MSRTSFPHRDNVVPLRRAASPPDRAPAARTELDQARAGDVVAMLSLARSFARPKVGPARLDRAFFWFHRAASLGSAEGRYATGMMCARGMGVPVDLAAARAWLALARDDGHAQAASALDGMAA